MNRKSDIQWKAAAAFSLIEVTIALGIAAFCLVTVFALLPIGLNSDQQSFENTVAGNISTAILADLRSVQTSGTSARYGIVIPAPPIGAGGATETSGTTLYLSANGIASPEGQVVMSGTAFSRYRATIGFYFPATGQYPASMGSRTATTVRVLITWPATADPTPGVWTFGSAAAWPTHYTGSYEADTALNCN